MHRHPYPIPLISFTIHEFMCQPHKQTIEIDESKVRNGDIRQWSLEFEWFRVMATFILINPGGASSPIHSSYTRRQPAVVP